MECTSIAYFTNMIFVNGKDIITGIIVYNIDISSADPPITITCKVRFIISISINISSSSAKQGNLITGIGSFEITSFRTHFGNVICICCCRCDIIEVEIVPGMVDKFHVSITIQVCRERVIGRASAVTTTINEKFRDPGFKACTTSIMFNITTNRGNQGSSCTTTTDHNNQFLLAIAVYICNSGTLMVSSK